MTRRPPPRPRFADPYTTATWNSGQRGKPELIAAMVDILTGNAGPGGRPAITRLIETGDIQDAIRRAADKAGCEVSLGPDNVPHGRKKTLLSDPDQVELKGDHWTVKTDDPFKGFRNGKVWQAAPRIVNFQEYLHLASGFTPIEGAGHEVPTQNHPTQRKHATDSIARLAQVLADLDGWWHYFSDWNTLSTTPQTRPIRELAEREERVILTTDYDDAGTWGSRCIDWGVVGQTDFYQLQDVARVFMPGREKGGERGHAAVFTQGVVTRVRKGYTPPK